jgi:hypothetical protein
LLVWIAIHENQSLTLHHANEVQVARNQTPVSPSPSTSTGVIQGTPAPSPKPSLSKQQSAAEQFAPSNAPAASDAADLRERRSEYQARIAPSKTLADKEAGARKDATRETSADALTATTAQSDLDAKNVPTTTQTVEVQAEAQPLIVQQQSQSAASLQQQNQNVANLPQQNQNVYESAKQPGPAQHGQATSNQRMEAAKPAAAPQPAPAPPTASGGVAGFTSAASMDGALISNPRLIAVPGSKAIWRVGRSGLIEFSADGGTSWSRQTSGTPADLITGSATSDQVCWIVGRAGTVLITTDAGAHWKLLSPPMPDDLGGVQASDALHARVWNSLNTKSFETTDGGVTWKRFVNE